MAKGKRLSYVVEVETHLTDISDEIQKYESEIKGLQNQIKNGAGSKELEKKMQTLLDTVSNLKKIYTDTVNTMSKAKLDSKEFENFQKTVDSKLQEVSERMSEVEKSVTILSKDLKSFDAGKVFAKQFNIMEKKMKDSMKVMRESLGVLKDFQKMTSSRFSEREFTKISRAAARLENMELSAGVSNHTSDSIQELEDELTNLIDIYDELNDKLSKSKSSYTSRQLQDEMSKNIVARGQILKRISKLASNTDNPFEAEQEIIVGSIKSYADELQHQSELLFDEIGKTKSELEKRIKDLGDVATTTAQSFQFKDGGIKIPVILDADAISKLQPEFNTLVEALNKYAQTNPVDIVFRLFPMGGTRAEEKEVAKSIKDIRTQIPKTNDPELQSALNSFVNNLEKQYQQALQLRIAINLSESATDIQNKIKAIKKAIEQEGFTIYPKFEISKDESEKIKKILEKVQSDFSFDIVKDITAMSNSLNKLLDENKIKTWGDVFSNALVDICNKLEPMKDLIQPLADLTVSQKIKNQRGRPSKETVENRSYVQQFTSALDALNKALLEKKKLDTQEKQFVDDIQNRLKDKHVEINVQPNVTGFVDAVQQAIQNDSVKINVTGAIDKNSVQNVQNDIKETVEDQLDNSFKKNEAKKSTGTKKNVEAKKEEIKVSEEELALQKEFNHYLDTYLESLAEMRRNTSDRSVRDAQAKAFALTKRFPHFQNIREGLSPLNRELLFDKYYNEKTGNVRDPRHYSLDAKFDLLKWRIARGNGYKTSTKEGRDEVKSMVEQFIKYQEAGGTHSIRQLTDNKRIIRNLTKEYEKQTAVVKENTKAKEENNSRTTTTNKPSKTPSVDDYLMREQDISKEIEDNKREIKQATALMRRGVNLSENKTKVQNLERQTAELDTELNIIRRKREELQNQLNSTNVASEIKKETGEVKKQTAAINENIQAQKENRKQQLGVEDYFDSWKAALKNRDGFNLRKTKDVQVLSGLVDKYSIYKSKGGTRDITDLTDDKALAKKLSDAYAGKSAAVNKYRESLKQVREDEQKENSATASHIEQTKEDTSAREKEAQVVKEETSAVKENTKAKEENTKVESEPDMRTQIKQAIAMQQKKRELDYSGVPQEHLQKIFDNVIEGVERGAISTANDGAKLFKMMVDSWLESMKQEEPKFTKEAETIIEKTADAIASIDEEFGRKAGESVVKGAKEATEDAQDSHSPAKVSEKLGEYWGGGYANGILNTTEKVKNAIRALVETGVLTTKDLIQDNIHMWQSRAVQGDIEKGKGLTKLAEKYVGYIGNKNNLSLSEEESVKDNVISFDILKNKSKETTDELTTDLQQQGKQFEQLGEGIMRVLSEIGLSYDEYIEKINSQKRGMDWGERLATVVNDKIQESIKGTQMNVGWSDDIKIDNSIEKILHLHPNGKGQAEVFSSADILGYFDKVFSKGYDIPFELWQNGQKTMLDFGNMPSSVIPRAITALSQVEKIVSQNLKKNGGLIKSEFDDEYQQLTNSLFKAIMERYGGKFTTDKDIDSKIDSQSLKTNLDILEEYVSYIRGEKDGQFHGEEDSSSFLFLKSLFKKIKNGEEVIDNDISPELQKFKEKYEKLKKEIENLLRSDDIQDINDAGMKIAMLASMTNKNAGLDQRGHVARLDEISALQDRQMDVELALLNGEKNPYSNSIVTTITSAIDEITQAEDRMGNEFQESTEQTKQGLTEIREEAKKTEEAIVNQVPNQTPVSTQNNVKNIDDEIDALKQEQEQAEATAVAHTELNKSRSAGWLKGQITQKANNIANNPKITQKQYTNILGEVYQLVKELEHAGEKTDEIKDKFNKITKPTFDRLFPTREEKPIDTSESVDAINKETDAAKEMPKTVNDAADSKNDFADANKNVLSSIVDSVKGLKEEKQAFDSLNKLISNIGGKDGDDKLNKTITGLERIRDVLNSDIEENALVRSLSELASHGADLEKLATVLKATKKQVDNAKKTVESNDTRSQDIIKNIDVGQNAKEFLKTYGEPINAAVEDAGNGIVRITSIVLTAENEFKRYTLETKDGINMSIAKEEERTAGLEKQILLYQKLRRAYDRFVSLNPRATEDAFIQRDSDIWDQVIAYANEYGQDLGNILSITRSVREANGELLESFKIIGENGSVTIGAKNDVVGSVQNIANINKQYKDLGNTLQTLQDFDLKNKETDKYTEEYMSRIRDMIVKVQAIYDNPDFGNPDGMEKLVDSAHKLLIEAKNTDNVYGNMNGIEKIRGKIEDILNSYGAMPRALKGEFKSLLSTVKEYISLGKISKTQADQIGASFVRLNSDLSQSGKKYQGLWKQMFERLRSQSSQLLARYFSFQDFIRYGRTIINTVVDLDTQLVDLRKTTTMNTTQLNEFYKSSANVAKELGVTTSEIISQAAAWSRLGYSSNEAATEMAKLSSKFASVSPGMGTDNAQDYLVSTMQAYGIAVDDVERKIMDNVNKIGNTFATTNAEIGEMLTRSSAAMNAANNSLEQTIALESAAVQITRDAEKTGTAFRTVSMRIRGKQSMPPYSESYMLCA